MRSLAFALLVAFVMSVGISEKVAAAELSAQALVTKAPAKRAKKARSAKAQDIGNVSSGNYNWSGLYGGFNAGYLWGKSAWNNVLPPANTMNPPVHQSMLGLHLGAQYNVRNSEPVGFLLGTEFAYSGRVSGNSSSVACVVDPTQSCRTRLGNLLTIGGRAGLTYQEFLLFGMGGYAQANVSTEQLAAAACGTGLCDRTRAHGWYAGTGLEYRLANLEFADVIVGLEWQHIRLDATRQLLFGGITATTRDVDVSADIVRARLSLKFNPFGTRNGNGDYKIDW